jgi:hypothetical protein
MVHIPEVRKERYQKKVSKSNFVQPSDVVQCPPNSMIPPMKTNHSEVVDSQTRDLTRSVYPLDRVEPFIKKLINQKTREMNGVTKEDMQKYVDKAVPQQLSSMIKTKKTSEGSVEKKDMKEFVETALKNYTKMALEMPQVEEYVQNALKNQVQPVSKDNVDTMIKKATQNFPLETGTYGNEERPGYQEEFQKKLADKVSKADLDKSVADKVSKADLDKSVADKVSKADLDKSVADKVSKADLDKSVADKVSKADLDKSVADKVSKADLDKSVADKVSKADLDKSVADKVSKAELDKSVADKVSKADLDKSVADKVSKAELDKSLENRVTHNELTAHTKSFLTTSEAVVMIDEKIEALNMEHLMKRYMQDMINEGEEAEHHDEDSPKQRLKKSSNQQWRAFSTVSCNTTKQAMTSKPSHSIWICTMGRYMTKNKWNKKVSAIPNWKKRRILTTHCIASSLPHLLWKKVSLKWGQCITKKKP